MKLKKCSKCGAIIKEINPCTCNDCITCCNEKMKEIKPNTEECAVEKHLPTYEVEGNEIIVKVNHVMTEEHLINWITLEADNKEYTVYLKNNDEPTVRFPYIKGSTLYSYCNLHGLWETKVE